MAKKTKNIEVISTDTIVETKNNEEVIFTKKTINDMAISELVYAEKAIDVICKKYENTLRNYDGSISRNSNEYNKFQTFNTLHNKIINKMEEKLLELI